MWTRFFLLVAVASIAGACSPGTLPGSPSPLAVGGGGARYNGTITYRRLSGGYTVSEAAQSLNLSLVMHGADQVIGRFQVGGTAGTLSGVLSGSLASGTFQATTLVVTPAAMGGTTTSCEGRGQVTGTLAGVNLTWSAPSITYDNCPGLSTTSAVQAVAVSPIPGSFGNIASLSITILGSTTVVRSTCGGLPGYPFTIEIAETAGIDVTLDSTFTVEERRNFGGVSVTVLDMPFTEVDGGSRRTYNACSPVAGTYQAFFSGTDVNGNRIRVASPIVTLAP
jgi:hypothetical protein